MCSASTRLAHRVLRGRTRRNTPLSRIAGATRLTSSLTFKALKRNATVTCHLDATDTRVPSRTGADAGALELRAGLPRGRKAPLGDRNWLAGICHAVESLRPTLQRRLRTPGAEVPRGTAPARCRPSFARECTRLASLTRRKLQRVRVLASFAWNAATLPAMATEGAIFACFRILDT